MASIVQLDQMLRLYYDVPNFCDKIVNKNLSYPIVDVFCVIGKCIHIQVKHIIRLDALYCSFQHAWRGM